MFKFIINVKREQRTGARVDKRDSSFAGEVIGDTPEDILDFIGAKDINQLRWDNRKNRIIFQKTDKPRVPGDKSGFLLYEIEVRLLNVDTTNVFGLVLRP